MYMQQRLTNNTPTISEKGCQLSDIFNSYNIRRLLLGTQETCFGRKTKEIAKFSILDKKKQNSQFWMKFGRKTPTDHRTKCYP